MRADVVAVAQGHQGQPRPPVLTTLRIAHNGAATVIDQSTWASSPDAVRITAPRLEWLMALQLVDEGLHALIAAGKATIGNQVLPG